MANALARAVAHFRTPLFRNSYALMLGSATTSVLGMFYWLIAARLYSPKQVGSNSAAISAIMFISGVALLSLDGALVRFVPIAGARITRLVGYTYLGCMGVVGLASLVICLGLRTWSAQLGNLFDTPAKMAFFIVSAIAWTVFTLEDSVLAGLRQAIWVPIANTQFALAKIGLLVVLATLFPVLGIFTSWMVAVIIILIPINFGIFVWLIPQHIRTTSDRTRPRLPQAWHAILAVIIQAHYFF